MFGYYLRLALKSFGRNPGITVLMVLAIALGIAVCVMTLTVYHAMSGNPIWWKNDRLYGSRWTAGIRTRTGRTGRDGHCLRRR